MYAPIPNNNMMNIQRYQNNYIPPIPNNQQNFNLYNPGIQYNNMPNNNNQYNNGGPNSNLVYQNNIGGTPYTNIPFNNIPYNNNSIINNNSNIPYDNNLPQNYLQNYRQNQQDYTPISNNAEVEIIEPLKRQIEQDSASNSPQKPKIVNDVVENILNLAKRCKAGDEIDLPEKTPIKIKPDKFIKNDVQSNKKEKKLMSKNQKDHRERDLRDQKFAMDLKRRLETIEKKRKSDYDKQKKEREQRIKSKNAKDILKERSRSVPSVSNRK